MEVFGLWLESVDSGFNDDLFLFIRLYLVEKKLLKLYNFWQNLRHKYAEVVYKKNAIVFSQIKFLCLMQKRLWFKVKLIKHWLYIYVYTAIYYLFYIFN